MFIYQHLQRLNSLDREAAIAALFGCFGSERWAAAMADARPFNLVEDVFEKAETAWASLPAGEWLEAFEVESNLPSTPGNNGSGPDRISELYQQKFGFPLISHTAGRPAEELSASRRARIDNSTQSEMRTAATELRKIALDKLNKLLEQELAPNADNAAPTRG